MSYAVSQKIRTKLNEKNLTIAALAREVGLKRPQVSSIVNGLRKAPIHQIKLILFTLGYSKNKVEELAKEYEDFYKVAKNNNDFKYISLMNRYQLESPYINPIDQSIIDNLPPDTLKKYLSLKDAALIITKLSYKKTIFKIAISIKDYNGAKKSGLRVFKFIKGIKSGTEVKDLNAFCSFLEIEPKKLLELFEFIFLNRTISEKMNLYDTHVSIPKDLIERINFIYDTITPKNEQSLKDYQKFAGGFIARRATESKRIIKFYPIAYKILEQKFKPLL